MFHKLLQQMSGLFFTHCLPVIISLSDQLEKQLSFYMNFEFVLQYFCDLNPPSRPPTKRKKNITCPSQRTKFTSQIAKFTSSRLSDMTFSACWLLQSASVTIINILDRCTVCNKGLLKWRKFTCWCYYLGIWKEFMVNYFFHNEVKLQCDLWFQCDFACFMSN